MAEGTGRRPLIVGLTGSIGMGKSETAKMFARLGVPVFDSDAVVHELYEKGGAAVEPVGRAFPGVVKDGRIDRGLLAERIGTDPEALRRLEAIVHPLVREKQREFLAAAARRGEAVVVLDIPLLFETGRHKDMDAVVVVTAPASVQRARVLSRPGMTAEKLAAIEARQVPDVDKRARADFVIETDKGFEHAFQSVKKILAELRTRAGVASP